MRIQKHLLNKPMYVECRLYVLAWAKMDSNKYSLVREAQNMGLREMETRNMRGRETCKRLDRYQFN